MKALAFSCSPRNDKGATRLVLKAFLEGLADGGAQVEVLFPYRMNIAPCRGCFHCWTKGKGKCAIDDDMKVVLAGLQEADMVVFATPVYHFTMSEGMKRLIERTMPLLDQHVTLDNNNRARHARLGRHDQRAFLLSVCGFPELEVFDSLRVAFGRICGMLDWRLSGEVLRTMSGLLLTKECREAAAGYLKLVRDAGKKAASSSGIDNFRSYLEEPLVPPEQYYRLVNEFWDRKKDR